MFDRSFRQRIADYDAWRSGVRDVLRDYGQWLGRDGLAQPELLSRVERMQAALAEDRITVAFVAELSRGKSELINAIFFARYGRRVLPSSAGRTTMCPTEFLFDGSRAPSIRLLPIETRLQDSGLAALRAGAGSWHEVPIDPDDADSVEQALNHVRQTLRVPVAAAETLGMSPAGKSDSRLPVDERGMVEIPRWRHAIVNMPDPLLEMGLVVIDTPGLNAIGNEAELTLNLIPDADALVFVLAADAGVTVSDARVWHEHVAPAHRLGRFVVLNKIDALWDELRSNEQSEREIERQVAEVARTLEIAPENVFPVSAQRALVSRVRGDAEALRRSRLLQLERALSRELVPRKGELLRERLEREFALVASGVASLLAARRRNCVEQLFELRSLGGKKRSVVEHIGARIEAERVEFDASLRQLQGLRSVFSRQSQQIFEKLAIGRLEARIVDARKLLSRSSFSTGLRTAMTGLLADARADLARVEGLSDDLSDMMEAMYRRFGTEHGFVLGAPRRFSLERHLEQLDRIDAIYQRHFGLLKLATNARSAVARGFLRSIVSRLRQLYERINLDLEGWMRAVMSPIEAQVREHQLQLRARVESVRRVLDATESLAERIAQVEQERHAIEALIQSSQAQSRRVELALRSVTTIVGEALAA